LKLCGLFPLLAYRGLRERDVDDCDADCDADDERLKST
jgi:hypothetical protein